MTVTVEKLSNEPIIVITYRGNITIEDSKLVYSQVADMVDTYGAPVCRIVQVCEDDMEMTFDDAMMMTTMSSKGLRGSVTDPDVFPIIVGEHILLDLFAEAMNQNEFGGIRIPIFKTLDEALNHARDQMWVGR